MAGYSAAASAVSNIAGDYMSMQGQQNMNLANRMFSAQQANIQRNWEQQMQTQAQGYNTMMSDTAIQRRMADAKAAGVNPMLAVTTGGASAPTMGAPSGAMAAPPQTGNPMQAFGNLGQQMTQSALNLAQTRQTAADAANKEAQNPYAAANARAQVEVLNQQAGQLKSSAVELSEKYNLELADTDKILQDKRFAAQLQDYAVRARDLENQGLAYGLTKQQLLSDFYQTPFGSAVLRAQQIREAGGEVPANLYLLGSSAQNVFKGFKYDPTKAAGGQQNPAFDPASPIAGGE